MNQILTTSYHPEWQTKRINFILEKYPEEFWKGKTILELGSHNGVIGEFFRSIGADVLSVEGRSENVNSIRARFPHLTVIEGNLDTPNWEYGDFDIIINFGLLYHLEHYHKEHLENCILHSDLLFLESVIFDSAQSELHRSEERYGNDQSLSGIGMVPSTKFVEDILRQNYVGFTKYSDGCLNAVNHSYNWEDKDSKNPMNSHRRFWIVECAKTI